MTKEQYNKLIIKQAVLRREAIDLTSENLFASENLQYITVKEIGPPFSGSFYLFVKNKYTGEEIEFGRLNISNYIQIQKRIDNFNRHHKASIPSIRKDPIYHIRNGNVKFSQANGSSYRELIKCFLMARGARDNQEITDLMHSPMMHHAEVVFTINPNADIMQYSSLKYRILIAKLALAK